jgi:hypothetical protein
VSDDESLAYVCAGSRVLRWTKGTASGEPEVFADGFRNLGNLYVNAPDRILVTYRGGHQVFRLDDKGARTLVAGSGTTSGGGDGHGGLDTGLNGVRGIWRHPLGGLLLATHAGSQVWYIVRRR